jgi:MFS family permease
MRYELEVPEPLVDMNMLRRRAVLTPNLTAVLMGFGMFGSFILIPQLVQQPASTGYGFGASVTEAGLFLLPSTTVMLFAGPIAGALGERVGSKLPLLMGTLLAATSFAFLAAIHDQRWAIYLGTAVLGLGIGFSFAAMANLVVEAVHQRQTGVATGMNTIMRTVGGSLGGQMSASVLSGHIVAATGHPSSSAFTLAFTFSTIAVLVAFGCALAIPERARRGHQRASGALTAPAAALRD